MQRTAVEVTCPDRHPVRTTARARSVRCPCGRSFYVRADGTTATLAPELVDELDQDHAEPAADVDPAPVPAPRRVPRVSGYVQPEPEPTENLTVAPVVTRVPAPPKPPADVAPKPPADVAPKPAQPGWRERLRQRRANAAARAAERPNTHPYPDLFDLR